MKKIIIWIVMQFLYRGLKVLYKDDIRIRNELDSWNSNKIIGIKVLNGPSITMEYTYQKGIKKTNKNPDILIVLKNVNSAFIVFTGRQSIKQAYLEHRFYLKGDIFESMRLVRCIDLVETYLFPRFMTKRILNHKEEKYKPTLLIYLKAIFTI